MPLRTFHHFDICTFTGCEHNSGTAKKSQGSGAAAAFAPTATINATQWVLAAKALGAGSAVMTARHEGGFALWPSKYTNYSIAHSPYMGGKGDIVMEFVTACRAHGLKAGLCKYLLVPPYTTATIMLRACCRHRGQLRRIPPLRPRRKFHPQRL